MATMDFTAKPLALFDLVVSLAAQQYILSNIETVDLRSRFPVSCLVTMYLNNYLLQAK
jgi:hypothetical protein